MLAYSASKAAVIGMTKVMGKEYAETGAYLSLSLCSPRLFLPRLP